MQFLDSVPQALRAHVEYWWERAASRDGFLQRYQSLPEASRAELPRIIAVSEFAAAVLIQDPEALTWCVRCDEPAAARAARADYAARSAAAADGAATQRLLREWRRREMLRIAWRDLAGRCGLRETLHDTSDFADACVDAAVRAAVAQLRPVHGEPPPAQDEPPRLIVLALGKLGGRELNFSSDIDLIMLYTQPGNEEYFNRLAREVIRLLGADTDDGFAFRIDLRLRPFGASGPLVVSLAGLEHYLQEHGRDWERYAWIKARAVVGADAYAEAYLQFVRPFVYRRYLDFGVFDSLRDMKTLIAREVSRHELDQHLKLGSGGIREIEFIVQSLQLVRGGSDRRLQDSSLLRVLPLLCDSKLLSPSAVTQLQDAYLLLRKAENGLQFLRNQQTHTLPQEPLDQARLALAMQLPDWPRALACIDAARARVAAQFEAFLFGAQAAQGAPGAPTDNGGGWLASDALKLEAGLAERGYSGDAAAAVAAALQEYRSAAAYRRLGEAGQRRAEVIVGLLLQAAAARAEPAVVVQRVLRVLEAIGARSSYLALLKEQRAALARLIDVCSISGFLARQIADFPLLLDELIDAKAFDELPSRAGFVQQLAARTERLPSDDPEREVESLRQFQKAAVFTVALADLTGRLPLMRVSDRLTDIAELIVECCVNLAWQQITKVHGVPHVDDGQGGQRPVAIAVAGYGKLGGLELGYGSDLDLVFLHDSTGAEHGVFFARLAQRIVHLLTMHSAAGRLYEVDLRLRPNGSGGFLMTGIDAFERYQLQDAWVWEHQALLRARAVAGDARLRAAFESARRRVLSTAVAGDSLRDDVQEMRQRMRKELSRAAPGQFDIKQGAGGIADIEFLVQFWVLAAARAHPELLTFTDNIRQLEELAKSRILSESIAMELQDAYIAYRTALHHLSLEGGERVVDAAPFVALRDRVTEIWHETFA